MPSAPNDIYTDPRNSPKKKRIILVLGKSNGRLKAFPVPLRPTKHVVKF